MTIEEFKYRFENLDTSLILDKSKSDNDLWFLDNMNAEQQQRWQKLIEKNKGRPYREVVLDRLLTTPRMKETTANLKERIKRTILLTRWKLMESDSTPQNYHKVNNTG